MMTLGASQRRALDHVVFVIRERIFSTIETNIWRVIFELPKMWP